ncbi:hypothetical protein FQN54_009969 [Arachnomyces sp. PD_36]|nr:hypothetical protein FQN54_009969 [Arachnomyces sp. PD_36]
MSRSPPPPSENHLDTLRGKDRRPLSASHFTSPTAPATANAAPTTSSTPTVTSGTASSTSSTTYESTPILPPLQGDRLPAQRWPDQRRNHDLPPPSQSQSTSVQAQVPGRLIGGSHPSDHHHQPPPPPQQDAAGPAPPTPAAAGGLSSSPVEASYLPLVPLTTSLPPRTTRRAKAHVPSACVNCKHKHLGCDAERPCRRCVASGKEATCKDVTHKKRGRPPLRAEESLMRHFETPFGLPDPSREPRLQMSPPVTRPNQHRRTSSSREIRPVTELRFPPRPGDPSVEHGRPGVGIHPHPPLWAAPPPAMSSSPLTQATASHGDHAAPRPYSSGSANQTTQPPPSPFSFSSPGGRPPHHYPSPATRAQPPPPYRGYGPPTIPPPSTQQQQQQSSLPAPFTPYHNPRPRSPHRPAISEPNIPSTTGPSPRDNAARPHSAESSPSEFRLPPILSSSPPTAGPDSTHQQRRGEMVPPQVPTRISYEQAPSQNRPREVSNPYPPALQPAFQATSASQSRPATAHQLPPSLEAPPTLPPLLISSQPAETPTSARESGSQNSATTTSPEETEDGSRPAKRRKMALGDMVNS